MIELEPEELGKLIGDIPRSKWAEVLGISKSSISKMFQRGRVRRRHFIAFQAARKVLEGEQQATIEDLILGGDLRGLYEVKLAGALHAAGEVGLASEGFINPTGGMESLQDHRTEVFGGMGRYADNELVAELESRGWKVTLALKKDQE